MDSETLKATDAYSAAKATHPRVSLASMQEKIATETYFNVGAAIAALNLPLPGQLIYDDEGEAVAKNSPLDCVTICVLTMKSGFVVIGKSAPASPENFDALKGQRFAYEDAIDQLWPLEGYLLKERLMNRALLERHYGEGRGNCGGSGT